MTNCLIIDDDPLASKILETFLDKLPEMQLIAAPRSAIDAFKILNDSQIDLIFLDIQMPDLSGIDFLRILKKRPKVIITTAYKDYALEGFELEVLDYLLKPILLDIFMIAINRYNKQNKKSRSKIKKKIDEMEVIYVKEGYKTVKIFVENILYLESLREYVIINTKDRQIKTKQKIRFFEEELNPQWFVRINKSYIVSIHKVKSFSQNEIEVTGSSLPIGRNYKKSVMDAFSKLY